ncbi:MAG: LD-carboxypeptidase [Candidatus Neptunochlamydia sp.]|nr:LD-carboxypeptidase [Candidatus Neptunochlamydia sp.]
MGNLLLSFYKNGNDHPTRSTTSQDAIALIAPAYCSDRIERTKAFLTQKGFRVQLALSLDLLYGKFAGNDEERTQALMEMSKNPEVKAPWCVRSRYG